MSEGGLLADLRRVRHGRGAEDLTQTALAKVYRHWSRVGAMAYPTAYVKRVLVREATSWRRRKASTEVVTDNLTTCDTRAPHPDRADAVAEADAMWQLLATLPPKQRAVLVLRYYQDRSDEQVAETVGCSPSTVRSNAARAFATLREAAGDQPKEVARDRR
ncbi:MAG: sigma-70 family RNA polymerase sigma factor [Actinomycetia bacterium]|nr:sigma-70 family RNA polymerase sigma factor [Actinomycetes bacterium]